MAKDSFVLDSFAILCLLGAEDGADEVRVLLDSATKGVCQLRMNVVNLAEVYYVVRRRKGEHLASDVVSLLESFPVALESVDKDLALVAANVKSRCAIALGDCFCVASAKNHSAKVVTGDPEFKKVEGEVGIKWLQEKSKHRKS